MEKLPDYSKLSPDLVKKLEDIRSRRPENVQLRTLEEIQSILEMFFEDSRNDKAGEEKDTKKYVELLTSMRDTLKSLDSKETPDIPDHAKPVVEGLTKLEKALSSAIKGIDVKPQVKVDSPTVKVDAPKIDLSGVEKAMKALPKSFEDAIKKIPQTELPEEKDYTQFFQEMLEQLQSIDTASRMKPQAPTSIGTKLTGDAGATWKDITQYGDGLTSGIAAVGIEYFNGQDYQRTQAMQVKVDKGTTDIIYIGKSKPGTGLASALWQITKVDKTVADNVTIKQADAGLFTATWNDRATETYS